ncbi:hypothetical protein BDK51DRAFT_36021 [Blyttiomyces helicus]|uniref:FAD-binding domain-containing protein n=1 Tax=Blyttiomyces helicus TaxID=388810 RepID=A0A4P9W0S3_9FUNG|nr:hypothetical protein BDK51DRAFT_36021 [Blyttiomyces helicus]|eukprot:RKO85694.1 hypothetical protein BDK51DRAFT_36021 [Blyttiomyces helicus]
MRVLISGVGIAGPTLAWFLARAGARITVLERSPAIVPHGQNVDIQGSARKVVQFMGLDDEVRRRNTTEKGTQFVNRTGRSFAAFPVNEGSSASLTSQYQILRGDLAAVLHNATKHHPNVSYLFGTTVRELSSGDVNEYDLVSKLRRQVFPAECVQVVDQGMYAVFWTIPRLPSDNDWWNIHLALGSRTQRAALHRASRADRPAQIAFMKAELADAGRQEARLVDAMDGAPDFYFQPIQQIKMKRWSLGRVVCLGDAAWAPTPLTGMGTSLALTGAYVLAAELARLGDGEHPATALDAFESPFVEEIQEIPVFVPGIAHHEKAWTRALF